MYPNFRSRSILFWTSRTFNPYRGRSIDDAQDPASKTGLGDDHLDRICGGTIDSADLLDILDGVQDIDGVAVPEKEEKRMACADMEGVLPGKFLQPLIVAFDPDKPVCRCFAECKPEQGNGDSPGNRLVEIFCRLDEVGVPQDHVDIF
ncbi:MAG TPA: hypothetical protein PK955_05825, partial [Methanoregulaceae archaeon]|nr:hypothetical protein [Methanoregulaceae archaeon]